MEHLLGVVLTGGRSRRFGRDKLREPVGEGMLVDAPVRALRAVLGSPVAMAGACDAVVAARGDLIIEDAEPGRGPLGGIIAALEHPLGADGVFVLAGDLPWVTAGVVRSIVAAGERSPGSWAVLGDTGRIEPCVGVYRTVALDALRARLREGHLSLHDALPAAHVLRVPVEAGLLRNVNEVRDLEGGAGQ